MNSLSNCIIIFLMNLLHKLYYGKSKPTQAQTKAVKKQLNASVMLPGHIGSRILDLELDLQSKTMTRESASELLSLYSEATEFYQARQDPKYNIYKARMRSLLENKDVYRLMFGEEAPVKLKEKGIEHEVQDAERHARQEAKHILEHYKKQQMRHEELIKKDVDKQNERINDRVQRRKSGLNRSGYGSFIGEPSKPSFTAKEKAKEI